VGLRSWRRHGSEVPAEQLPLISADVPGMRAAQCGPHSLRLMTPIRYRLAKFWGEQGLKMRAKGFSLIELMIVVTIIAVLTTIALPAYQDYVARSQVAEGMIVAGGARLAVSEFHADHATWPPDHTALPLSPAASISGRYVSSTSVGSDGKITVAYARTASSERVRNADLVLVPTASTSGIRWSCEGSIEPNYLPSSCR